MAQVIWTNNAESTLAADLTNVATSLSLVDASKFPVIAGGSGDWFYITIANADFSAFEILKITATSGNTLTAVRGQDGTTAAAWSTTSAVSHGTNVQNLRDIANRFPVRTTATITTASLAANATENGSITLAKTSQIFHIETDFPAWIRLYDTDAARTADASRLSTVFPTAGTGVVADIVTAVGALAINQSPVETFVNNDSPAAAACYYAIKNLDSVDRAITLTIVHFPQES
jgi:hypothetical protein